MPGTVFHLVSRTHRREAWFDRPLRTDVAAVIRRMVGRTDAKLLAYAVMPTHLHVLLRQGPSPLVAVMQPLLRTVANRVQARHGIEGSIVERRYRDRPCYTPSHARDALVYVHLNPWRAGLCGDDLGYPWATHRAYLPGEDPTQLGIDPAAQSSLLELFSHGYGESRNQLCRNYMHWVGWRMNQDRSKDGEPGLKEGDPHPVASPSPRLSDSAWRRHFSNDAPEDSASWARPDLRDFIDARLAGLGAGLELGALRGSWLPREPGRVRRELIRIAADRGYGTVEIARFFRVSPQTVSRVRHATSPEAL